MSKMKLETLTSLHIGSGNMLQKDSDFVFGKDAEDFSVVGVIDPRKVLALVGEENIDAWTVAIENGRSTNDIVKQYAPNATIADYSLHTIDSYLSRTPQQIKEFIRDGLDRPYIPGSSIKGAIRTAVLASIAATMNDADLRATRNNGNITAKTFEAKVFGKDPNHDVFRYLLVGDAFATGYRTAVYNMVNINERTERGFWDTSKQMATEVLLCGTEVYFSLVLKQPELRPIDMPAMPKALSSVNALLNVINNHTRTLLADEIDIWESKNVDSQSEEKVNSYIEQLKDLLNAANECQGKHSAVMRIGHGSGWRFITGAWTERLPDNDFDAIVNKARPGNMKRYADYDFPKSRRLEEDECEPLGFVKITLCN